MGIYEPDQPTTVGGWIFWRGQYTAEQIAAFFIRDFGQIDYTRVRFTFLMNFNFPSAGVRSEAYLLIKEHVQTFGPPEAALLLEMWESEDGENQGQWP